jgi:hypothetical protein
MNCPSCNTKLGCSCKLRKASDGKQMCTHCITNYEKGLQLLNQNVLKNLKKP